jgi:hypothetical protein
MKEMKKDLFKRLKDLPTTLIGIFIILFGFFLVYNKTIQMSDFISFCAVSLPFFLMKKESSDTDKTE